MSGIFPSGNFSRVSSPQRLTPSLFQPRRSAPQSNLAVALGPHCSLRRLRGPNLTFGKLPLGKLHIWEVATWKIDTWEVALGKMPYGKYLYTFIYTIQGYPQVIRLQRRLYGIYADFFHCLGSLQLPFIKILYN